MDLPAVGIKDVVAVMETGTVSALPDVNDVEAAIELIKRYDEQVDELKDYKKKKAGQIDQAISDASKKADFLRSVITKTLAESGKKSISFPGLAKVNLRVKKGKWVIADEEALLKVLKKENEYKNVVEEVPTIRKKELNGLLDVWERIQKVPPCVIKEDDEETVTISFDEPSNDPSAKVISKAATVDVKSLNFTA